MSGDGIKTEGIVELKGVVSQVEAQYRGTNMTIKRMNI